MSKKIIKSLQSLTKAPLKLSPRLNYLYNVNRRNRNLFRTPVKTSFGFLFCGSKAMETGVFEQNEVGKIRSKIMDADLFVNIGANIGYYVCIAASMGKPVIAFEPDNANCNLLYRNIHLNGYENSVEVFPLALAEKSGLIEIFGHGTGASIVNFWDSKEEPVLIPVNVLDQVLAHRLSGKRNLFLMDVEGAEHLVLKGATQCLDVDAEWVVEVTAPALLGKESDGGRFISVFQIFADKGFETYLLNDGKPVTFDEVKDAEHGKCPRLAREHMFVFRKAN